MAALRGSIRTGHFLAPMLVVGGLLAAAPVPADADVALTATTPAAGALLPSAPAELRLTFSGPVNPDTASVTVAVDGRDPVPAQTSSADSVVRVTMATTPPGPAEQLWRVAYRVQAADGHPAIGLLSFSVARVTALVPPASAPSPAPTSTRPSSPVSAGATAGPPGLPGPTDQHRPTSRWYFFVIGAVMLFLGPLVALAWSSRPIEDAEPPSTLADEPATAGPGQPHDPPPSQPGP